MEDRYSLSLQQVNGLALPLGLLLLGGGTWAYAWRHGDYISGLAWERWLWGLALLLPAIPLHEAIHAAVARYFGAEARFGFDRRTWTPYVHVQTPLRVWQYRWQAAAPTLLLGVLPLALGWLTGGPILYFFGLIMCLSGLGDGIVLWLLRAAPADFWALDHPSRVGCQVFAQRPEAR